VLTIDLDRAAISPGQRILDLGCGGGRHAFACLKAGANVVAIDLKRDEVETVANMVAAMRAAEEIKVVNASVLVGDAMSLPVPDAVFDRVIVSELLEHLLDDECAIAEVVRVLRPGGLVALSVPRAGPERLNWALSRAYHEVEGGHVRIYGRRALVGLLERSGLRLLFSHHAHGLHAPYWWLRCAVGVDRDSQVLVAAYHRFLVWDIVHHPRWTRVLEAALNPLIGKSLVLYLEKPTR
jgi:SAM-dependent methyltransferase